jgi:septal ring factor EnvC (AmiA/AmiB activator)
MTESLGNIAAELAEAWQRLNQRWHETTQLWDDRVRWQFEKEFWQPLEAQVTATQRELERLAQGISKAHRSIR